MDVNRGSPYQRGGQGSSELHKFSHNIGSNIQKISQNVKSIKQLVNQLGTDQDNQQLRSQLKNLNIKIAQTVMNIYTLLIVQYFVVQHYTGGLAKDTNVEIKTFQNYAIPAGEDPRAWQMQIDRLTKEFTQALNDFQTAQRQAAAKEKEALKEAKAQSDAAFFENETGGSALVDLSGKSNKSSQMQIQMEQEELQALQEREAQIRQLESDIFDVNQIFKDLATMVHEQGEVIDSIEANVEMAQQNVGQGASQLNQAAQYQNKARRKKLCLFIIFAVVLAVLILIIVLSTKN
ncbi:Syntaxin-7 [Armadillidium nasatum]|uniref:Syntaxin-7 n=1 Tax=Armadillidium nasatum TaxID=96803 RepID=A0A5N5T3B1_9CRUS|nr:Syntaxin-7 [Armadillidium nasatum]